jgi:hypothetical protein
MFINTTTKSQKFGKTMRQYKFRTHAPHLCQYRYMLQIISKSRIITKLPRNFEKEIRNNLGKNCWSCLGWFFWTVYLVGKQDKRELKYFLVSQWQLFKFESKEGKLPKRNIESNLNDKNNPADSNHTSWKYCIGISKL